MDFYFDSYAEYSLQRLMVSDRPRTDAFADAIKEVIKGGERVLDIGTGTGLLAMLAAKAGSGQVHAIDQARIAEAAKKSIERNNLTDKIEVLNSNAHDLELDEKVDMIVSEWLGHFAFVENMLDDVIIARDKNLKPGGIMMPSDVELFLAPIESPILYDAGGPGFWRNKVHDIDFRHLEDAELEQAIAIKTTVNQDELIAPGQSLLKLDLVTAKAEDPWQSGTLKFTPQQDGFLDGFVGWFTAQLSPSVLLDTGPQQPGTHWQQSYFALPSIEIEKNKAFEVFWSLTRHAAQSRCIELKLSVLGHEHIYTVG